jgi:hypothetical protein
MQTLNSESINAAKALEGVEQTLPPIRRIPLKTIAISVCLAAGTPLTLSEIQRRVLLNGYKTKSKYFTTYLRRIMIKDERFILYKDGCWTVIQRRRNESSGVQ